MDWSTLTSWAEPLRLDLLVRLLLAAVLGGAIGLEREMSGKPAGFRTNLLICVGATLLTELSIEIAMMADPRSTNTDPGRIAAQIVSGIGFLGAGTIIQARGSVIGLTTAATLWVVAAIGMAVGARAYVEAIGTTVLVIVALLLLVRVEDTLLRRRAGRAFQVTLDPDVALLETLDDLLRREGIRTETRDVERTPDAIVASYQGLARLEAWENLPRRLLELRGVRKIVQQ